MMRECGILFLVFVLAGLSAGASELEKHLTIGMDAYTAGRYDEALIELREAEKLDPKNPDIHLYLGLTYYNLKDYDKAVPHLKKAEELNPDLALKSNYYLGLIYYYTCKGEEAKRHFERVLDISPEGEWAECARECLQAISEGNLPYPPKEWELTLDMSYGSDDNVEYVPYNIGLGGDEKAELNMGLSYNPILWDFQPILSYSFNTLLYKIRSNYNTDKHSLGVLFPLSPSPVPWGYLFLMGEYASALMSGSPYYIDQSIGLSYIFNLFADQNAGTSVSLNHLKEDFQSTIYEALSNVTNSISIKQNLNKYIYLTYENKESDAKGEAYSYSGNTYSIYCSIPFPGDLCFKISRASLYKNFLNIDPIGGKRRTDEKNTYNFILEKKIIFDVVTSMEYTFITNNCNLDEDQTILGYGNYVENIVKLSISKVF